VKVAKKEAKKVVDESRKADAGVSTAEALLERYEWRRVEIPRTWYPKEVGAQLVGFYGGRTTRSGSHGQYDVIIVHVPGHGAYVVSGVKVLQLVDASMADVGDPICVVYKGEKKLAEDRKMKLFDLFVAEGEPIDASMLPRVEAPT